MLEGYDLLSCGIDFGLSEGENLHHRLSQHEDSAGHKGTISEYLETLTLLITVITDFGYSETGGVQWMCAGKGIIHAEMPVHTKGSPDPIGLQLWVDLPKEVSIFCIFYFFI